MTLKLIVAPDGYPVTLDEAKMHLRVDGDLDNDLIYGMIGAATEYVEGETGILSRALLPQTWDYFIDAIPASCNDVIELPLPPLIEVLGFYYLDSDGNEQTFDPASYTVDPNSKPARIQLNSGSSWPSYSTALLNALRIRFQAGYINSESPPSENVPRSIKQAILLLVSNMYQNRETYVIGQSVTDLPWAAKQLLRLHNVNKGFA